MCLEAVIISQLLNNSKPKKPSSSSVLTHNLFVFNQLLAMTWEKDILSTFKIKLF